jgi:hypothetical protein
MRSERKSPAARRIKAEALVNNFGTTGLKIAALDLQAFSTEDRDMINDNDHSRMGGLAVAESCFSRLSHDI